MGTSIIDGTLTAAKIGRSRKNLTVFSSLTFERDDGSTETLKRQVVGPEVAQWLQPGARGRFYRFSAFDVKGIHGVRLRDGVEIHAYPDPNKVTFPVLILIFAAWIVTTLVTQDKISLLAVLAIVLVAIGFFTSRAAKRESAAEYERDGARLRNAAATAAVTP